jgi:hypothetical protein
MLWLVITASVLAGVGLLIFVLTRDSLRAARNGGGAGPLPEERENGAARLNNLVREKTPSAGKDPAASLLPRPEHAETEDFADTLARLPRNAVLPQAPKAYLRMVEEDDEIDRLLAARRGGSARRYTLPAREFRLEVVKEEEAARAGERKPSAGAKQSACNAAGISATLSRRRNGQSSTEKS